MDLDDQWKLSKIIEQYGAENVQVIIGCPDAESSQIQTETVSLGDPSLSGPLTNTRLHLYVRHIVEPDIVKSIPDTIFTRHIRHFLSNVDAEAIIRRMNEVRTREEIRFHT